MRSLAGTHLIWPSLEKVYNRIPKHHTMRTKFHLPFGLELAISP